MFFILLENLATVRSNDGQSVRKGLNVRSGNCATYLRSDSARSAGNLRRGKMPAMACATRHDTIGRSRSLRPGSNLEPKVMSPNHFYGSKSRKMQARP